MANPWRGEVVLRIDGEARVLKLTLGALAELEAAMEADSLVEVVERFETGRFRSRDVAALILAGLRGGGWTGDAEAVARAEIEGGAAAAVQAAVLLIARAFALPGEASGGAV